MRMLSSPSRIAGLLLLGLALLVSIAQAASYVYDDNGRLRAVTSSTGASSVYNYDALGNITSINSVPSGQLGVFSFTPNHGPVGSGVKIIGQGFAVGSAPTVKFNGVTVSPQANATSTTQLLETVPAGATTGTISVKFGTTTVVSNDVFTVTTDSGGQPPTIASFTPTIANPGTSISVTGNQFVTSAGTTYAGVNDNLATVTPASNTQLSFSVGNQTGTGPVTVQTPYSEAQSSSSLIVLPASVPASSVGSTSALSTSTRAPQINIATGKSAIATFSGPNGQWLSLQFSGLTTTPTQDINVFVYGPSGASLAYLRTTDGNAPNSGYIDTAVGVINSGNLSVHIPVLPSLGTYTVVFQPASGGSAQFTASLESNPAVLSTGTTNIATQVAGQSKRVTYAGTYLQFFGVYSTYSTTPTGGTVSQAAFGPDAEYLQDSLAVVPFLNFWAMTESGIGNLIYSTDNTHTFSASLQLGTNPINSIAIDGSSVTEGATYPTEYDYLWFAGTAGQQISIALSNISLGGAPNGAVGVDILPPTYMNLPLATTYLSMPSGHYGVLTLSDTGNYLLRFFAQSGNPYTIALTATLSTIATGALSLNSAFSVSLPRLGQMGQYTFTPAAAYTFPNTSAPYTGFCLKNVSTSSGGNMTLTVIKPDGSALINGSGSTSTGMFLNLNSIPQSGTYKAQVETDGAETATAQLTLMSNPLSSVTVNGAGVSQATTCNGEWAYQTFYATAGQSMTLNLSNIALTPSSGYVYYNLYTPSGGYYTEGSLFAPSGQRVLPAAPETGNYLILFSPSGGVQNQIMSYTTTITLP